MRSRFNHYFPWEALVWAMGLLALALMHPTEATHFTICPIRNLGYSFCPGCGLGRAITLFFHGQILHSLSVHPFGIFAVFILSFRIVWLVKQYFKYHGKNNRHLT